MSEKVVYIPEPELEKFKAAAEKRGLTVILTSERIQISVVDESGVEVLLPYENICTLVKDDRDDSELAPFHMRLANAMRELQE